MAVVNDPEIGCAELVHQEHPIGITVERQADVCTGLEDARPQVGDVVRIDRVGRMVGEGAIELRVHDLQVHGEALEHRRNHQATHAIGGVGHDFQGPQVGRVDEGVHVCGEIGEHVALGHRSAMACGLHAIDDELFDLGEAALGTDRRRAGSTHLDAVVLGRVVRGREDGAGHVE